MNTPIKCLIVDDEPLAIELIKNHLSQIPNMELVATCQHAMMAFEVLKKEPIDLMFLDIQMPMLTGIDLVKSLPHPPGVIFTTAYRDYALESYELDVIDYLLKPITFTRFFKAINKFLDHRSIDRPMPTQTVSTQVDKPSSLYVNVNKKRVRVYFDQVLYIESIKDYVRIHTPEKRIMTKEKISEFEQKLPAQFLRTHRSYIVNTDKITAYTAQDIEIGDYEIPIGISYKQQVMDSLNR